MTAALAIKRSMSAFCPSATKDSMSPFCRQTAATGPMGAWIVLVGTLWQPPPVKRAQRPRQREGGHEN
jgi:hypothetical protein